MPDITFKINRGEIVFGVSRFNKALSIDAEQDDDRVEVTISAGEAEDLLAFLKEHYDD